MQWKFPLQTDLKQTEQGAAPAPPLTHHSSSLPFTGWNFYKERGDVQMQNYARAQRRKLKHQSISVTPNCKKKERKKKGKAILKAFKQIPKGVQIHPRKRSDYKGSVRRSVFLACSAWFKYADRKLTSYKFTTSQLNRTFSNPIKLCRTQHTFHPTHFRQIKNFTEKTDPCGIVLWQKQMKHPCKTKIQHFKTKNQFCL